MPTVRTSEEPALETIRNVPPFSMLTEDEWREVVRTLTVRTYPEDTYLFFEGDPPSNLYVIVQGHVALIRHTLEGRDVVLDVMQPGNMVGELAIFEGVPYSSSGKTLDEVTAVVIPRERFHQMLAQYPRMAGAVIFDLTRRVRHLSDLVQSLAIERVERRLARILLRLARISGEHRDDGLLINLPLTRQDLADMAGTTVETAIRTLSRMRRQGIVDTSHGHLIIRDVERLVRIAEEGE